MEYKILYSKRKTVGISVNRGEITVRAPYGCNEDFIKKTVNAHELWIKRALEKDEAKMASEPRLTDADIKILRSAAREYFTERCRYYSALMSASYTGLTITGAKTRFGSCSSKKSISFSYLLMLYPPKAREYVVVHELAHLFEMNHSQRFYSIVEKFMPDYKERRALLKQGIQRGTN